MSKVSVWIVERQMADEHSIEGIFSSEALKDEFLEYAERHGDDYQLIDYEYVVDEYVPAMRSDKAVYVVTFRFDSDVVRSVELHGYDLDRGGEIDGLPSGTNQPFWSFFEVAMNPAEAIELATKRRAEYIKGLGNK